MFKGLKALVAGVIAGTALGVLFSPKKGTEIRKDLQKEIKGGGSGFHTVKGTLMGMGAEVKDVVGDTEAYKKGSSSVKKYAKEAKKQAKDLIKKKIK